MSGDEGKYGDHYHAQQQQQQQQYGTFEGGPPVYPPLPPAVGFPQPVPPPGVTSAAGHPSSAPAYYAHGYQAVPGNKTQISFFIDLFQFGIFIFLYFILMTCVLKLILKFYWPLVILK